MPAAVDVAAVPGIAGGDPASHWERGGLIGRKFLRLMTPVYRVEVASQVLPAREYAIEPRYREAVVKMDGW